MVVIGILGLLVGILAVAVIPKLTDAKNKLEVKQVGDLMSGFKMMQTDDGKLAKLKKKKVSEAKGEKFYEVAFKERILEDELLAKIVSLNPKGGDTKAGKEWITQEGGELPANSCSYTCPKGSELINTMTAKGEKRTVFLTFNTRNWNNYEEHGTLVQWSDGDSATYLTKEDASSEFSIDESAWNNPDELIGQRKPFDKTHN